MIEKLTMPEKPLIEVLQNDLDISDNLKQTFNARKTTN